MKIKKFLLLMTLCFVAIILVACGEKAIDVVNENIEKIAISYSIGENQNSVTNDVTLGKIDAEGITVEWESDNAAITKEGKVTRPAAGENDATVKLTVTVKYKDASASKDFTLVVKAMPKINPLALEITGTNKLVEKTKATFEVSVLPENATNKEIVWSSDDENIATVDENGVVTAKHAGTCNIIATSKAISSLSEAFVLEVVERTADTVEEALALPAGEEGWVKAVVIGVYKQGYLVSDGTASIIVYMGSTEFTQKNGDYVSVRGNLVEHNGVKQFDASATVTAIEEEAPSVTSKAEKLKDEAAVTAFMGAFVLYKKVTIRVTVKSISEKYINCVVKDSEVAISLTYPLDTTGYKADTDYDVTGYALEVKAYNNVNTLYIMVEKALEVDYGFDVNITYKDGETTEVKKVNSLLFPITELPILSGKEGYVFLGWYTGTEEAPVKVYSIDVPVDTTVFARWATEADAPLFVYTECTDGTAYTSISAAIAAAREGQEIILAPGEYKEDYTTLAERIYLDNKAVAAAYIADFNATTGKTLTADTFDTNYCSSSDITTMLNNTDMTTKWSWLYDALVAATENEDMALSSADTSSNAVKGFYFANLCGFFTGTKHTDTWLETVSADFTSIALVTKVMEACAKVDSNATDTTENKIVITKSVKITGPNANIHGNDSRYEEAEIKSTVEVKANNVTFNGCAFLEDGAIGIGGDNLTINNCYIKTSKYLAYGEANRKGSIANITNAKNFQLLNSYIYTPGTSYKNEAIAIDGTGITNIKVDHCYFDTDCTSPQVYENIMMYAFYGEFIFTNNECYFATTGYFARIGNSSAKLTYALVENNIFSGVNDCTNSTFAFVKPTDNGAIIDIIHNEFNNCAPSTIILGAAKTVTTNVLYNYFDEATKFKIENGTTINFDYNIVLGAVQDGNQVDPTKQANKPADKTALEAAYATYAAEVNREATITLDLDGGNVDGATSVEPIKFKKVSDVVLPTPVKEGCEFAGWYNGENKVTKITEKTDVTLKAKWLRINTITFDVDGGSEVGPISFTDFAKVTLTAPTKEGLIFAGWYDGDTRIRVITENKDYTLKAKWQADFTITFDVDGGTALDPITYTDYTQVVLPTPVNGELLFAGWYDGDTKVNALVENGDITLKAHWTNEFTLTYDVDGGTPIDPVNYVDYTTVTLVTPVDKEGYVFGGWYNGETKYEALTENITITLKAKWIKINTITFNVDGGETVAEMTFTDYKNVTLPTTTKADVVFGGWLEGETLITSINENRDYNLTAKWLVKVTLTLPTEIAALNPTIAVFADADSSKAYYNGENRVYVYKTIDAAFVALKDNDIIYLFAGNYMLTKTSTKAVKIYGPNAFTTERVDEAVLDMTTKYALANSSFELNGVKICSATERQYYFYPVKTVTTIKILNCLIDSAAAAGKKGIDSLIRDEKYTGGAGMNIEIRNCDFKRLDQFVLFLGKAECTTVANVIDCTFTNCLLIGGQLFRISTLGANVTINAIGCTINNDFTGPGKVTRAEKGTINVKYCTFKGVSSGNYIYASEAGTITFDSNLYLNSDGSTITPAPVTDVNAMADVAALQAAYELYKNPTA